MSRNPFSRFSKQFFQMLRWQPWRYVPKHRSDEYFLIFCLKVATGTGSHVAHFAANFPKVLPRKHYLLYIYRHNRLRWPGSRRIWTRSVLKAWEPTGATKFLESRPISYLWIIMNLTYQTSIHQISQDSFSVKVSPISFHSSRLMQRILLLLYFRS